MHLLENILPWIAYRQYAVTAPVAMRFWLARSPKLMTRVHGIITTVIRRRLRVQAKAEGIENPLTGSVTFTQRYGSALNTNIHWHLLVPDGVFAAPASLEDRAKFHQLSPPTDEEVGALIEKISKRVMRHLKNRGFLAEEGTEEQSPVAQGLFDKDDGHLHAVQASVVGRIAFGPRAGQKVRRIGSGFGFEEEVPLVKSSKCVSINGFILHAATAVRETDRKHLSRLVSYGARPPLATQRLNLRPDGDLEYTLKRPYSDGTSAILLSPEELLEKLAALVPPARAHTVLHTGVFSSHSKWRKAVVLKPEVKKGFSKKQKMNEEEKEENSKVKNHLWAKLLARVFKINVSHCPRCGGDMLMRAPLQDPAQIARYLKHVGEGVDPPPIAPIRRQLELVDADPQYSDA